MENQYQGPSVEGGHRTEENPGTESQLCPGLAPSLGLWLLSVLRTEAGCVGDLFQTDRHLAQGSVHSGWNGRDEGVVASPCARSRSLMLCLQPSPVQPERCPHGGPTGWEPEDRCAIPHPCDALHQLGSVEACTFASRDWWSGFSRCTHVHTTRPRSQVPRESLPLSFLWNVTLQQERPRWHGVPASPVLCIWLAPGRMQGSSGRPEHPCVRPLLVACRRRLTVGSKSKHRPFSVQGKGALGLETELRALPRGDHVSHTNIWPWASLF